MAEEGSRTPASRRTALENVGKIGAQDYLDDGPEYSLSRAMGATDALRKELEAKGLKGFKKGGKVKKTGVYKLHKGEKVVTAAKTRQEARDKKLLQKTRYR